MKHDKKVEQLEQSFSATIQSMLSELSTGWSESDTAAVKDLWRQMEQQLVLLPDPDQLRLAGQIILHLAELCYAKSKRWLNDWEAQFDWETQGHEMEPLWDDALLAGLVQKTMYLDLSDLVKARAKPVRSKPPSGSIAGAVSKKQLLKALDTIEEQETAKQKALSVAHDEDVSAWIKAIDTWMKQRAIADIVSSQQVWFSDLCQGLCQENPRMTPVKIFLALLLGGYSLEQPGGFYKSDILINGPNS